MSHKLILYLVSFATFLGPFTQTIYTPIIPEVQSDFQTSQLLINFTISIFTIALAVMQLVYGPLVDRYGKRKILIPGLSIYVLSSLACAYANSIEQLLIFRTLQAVGIAAGSVVATTVIAELFNGKGRGQAMGQFQMFVALGPVVGPVVGGYVGGNYGFHGVFLVLGAAGLVMLLANVRFLPETGSPKILSKPSKSNLFKEIISHPIGSIILCLGFFQYYAFYHFLVFLPELLSVHHGLSAEQKGLFFLSLSLMMVIGSFLGGRLLVSMSESRRLLIYTLFLAVSMWLFTYAAKTSLGGIAVCMGMFGLFFGLSLPVQTTWLTECFTQRRATAAGMYNFSRYLGMAAGPLLGSLLYEWGDITLLFGFAACAFVCVAIFIKVQYSRYSSAESENINHVV